MKSTMMSITSGYTPEQPARGCLWLLSISHISWSNSSFGQASSQKVVNCQFKKQEVL